MSIWIMPVIVWATVIGAIFVWPRITDDRVESIIGQIWSLVVGIAYSVAFLWLNGFLQ